MLSASRNVRHLLANPGACSLVLQRGMALDGLSGFSERETARENVYFKKEEEATLRKLLSKLKKQSDEGKSKAELEALKKQELAPIQSLLTKYKISDADADALLEWKHHHH